MLEIRPLKPSDIGELKTFTDREIGEHYYSDDELEDVLDRSNLNGVMYSLVLVDQGERIQGVRITYPPGRWQSGKGDGLSPGKWPHPLATTAYFQSIFLAREYQGKGWGGQLSRAALEILRAHGTKGVVCHSWKESPNDSSNRYLKKLGFEVIDEYPRYWANVPYICVRCQKPPCECTAVELYLNLVRNLEKKK